MTPEPRPHSVLKFAVYLIIITIAATKITCGQAVGISSTTITPDASSILELRTTSKGFLIPRMTQAQRDAINSGIFATGLLIYNTDLNKFNFYDGSGWRTLFSGSSGVNSITGTANRISLSGTASDPIIDIASNYSGQTSITTLGTISTGTWSGSTIADNKIASALTGKTYNNLSLTALTNGFAISGGTTSKTLTVPADASVSGLNTGDQTITLTGDVTGSGTGSFAATIASNSVTNAKAAQMPANSIKGNNTASVANSLDLTGTQVTAMLDNFTSTTKGLAPLSGGGTANFLRADGTWAVPPGTGVTSVSGTGNIASSGGTTPTISFTGTLPIASGGTNSTATPTAGAVGYGTGTAHAYTSAGTTGQVLMSNGSSAPGWKDSRTIVVLGSDVTNNNATANTIADVTGLSFSVTAGTTYRFEATINYTSAATTTGSRWSINGPASPTILSYTSNYTLTATSQTVNYSSTYDSPSASNATSLTTGNIAIIKGIIKPSANGTVTVRFASEVANSAIIAKAGSTLEWW